MDQPKEIILELLTHQMKHEQLMQGISKLGFRNEIEELDLSGIIAELMGIPQTEITWNWMDAYMDFLRKAKHYEFSGNEKNLPPLAETYYTLLKKLKAN